MTERRIMSVMLIVLALAVALSGCGGNNDNRNVVYEDMKLVGITPGASLSPNGKEFRYGVLIPVSEIKLCLEEMNNGASN